MTLPTPKDTQQSLKSFFKKRAVQVALFFISIILAFLLLLPFALKKGVQSWLVENGAEQAVISSLSMNLFTGTLNVKGFDVGGGGKVLLAANGLGVDVDILPLLRKEIYVRNVYCDQLVIQLSQKEDGQWQLGTYDISKPKEGAEEKNIEPWTWVIRVGEGHVKSATVEIASPTFSTRITVDDALLTNFSTDDKASPAEFSITGEVGGTPIRIEAAHLGVGSNFIVDGKIDIAGFDLGTLRPLIGNSIGNITGTATVKGDIAFGMVNKQPKLNYNGDINVTEGNLQLPEHLFTTKSIVWSGQIDAQEGFEKILTQGKLILDDTALEISQQGMSLKNKHVLLEGETAVSLAAEGVEFNSQSKVSFDGLQLNLFGSVFKFDHMDWEGILDNKKNKDQLDIDSSLNLAGVQLDLAALSIALSSKNVAAKGITSIDMRPKGDMHYNGMVTSEGLTLLVDKITYGYENLRWQGDIKHGISEKVSKTITDGALEVVKLYFSSQDSSPMHGSGEHISWVGNASYSQVETGVFASLDVSGNATGRALRHTVSGGDLPLDISIADMQCNDIKVNDQGVILNEWVLDGVSLYSPIAQENVAELSKITLNKSALGDDFSFSTELGMFEDLKVFPIKHENRHSVELVAVEAHDFFWDPETGFSLREAVGHSLALDIVMWKNGSMNLTDQLASLSSAQPLAPGTIDSSNHSIEQQGSSGVRIGAVKLVEENTILFTDHTLLVPFKSKTVLSKLLIEDINSRKKEQDTHITVVGLMENRAPFVLQGTLRPFVGQSLGTSEAHLKFEMKNYPLSNLSPYMVESAGTGIESGQLKMQGTFDLSGGKVNVQNDLLIKKLVTQEVKPELAQQVSSKLPVPLNVALSMLRDKNDNISLHIPISGTLAKLKFDLSDAFITALGKSVVPAASSYLMYALGPYGALAWVGMKLGENVLQVRLPAVEFSTGEVTLTTKNKDYLKRVGKIMHSGKAQFDTQLCPVVNIARDLGREGALLREISEDERQELVDLGQQRARVVQSYLVEEQGVDIGRLLLCVSRLEEGKALSLVEIQQEK